MLVAMSLALMPMAPAYPADVIRIVDPGLFNIRRESLTIMATWNSNLYKRCLEGVAEFERLRPRVKPATEPAATAR
jgi:hypothetical protein